MIEDGILIGIVFTLDNSEYELDMSLYRDPEENTKHSSVKLH